MNRDEYYTNLKLAEDKIMHSITGNSRSNHKYVKREEVDGKYLYFYSVEAYEKWAREEENIGNEKNNQENKNLNDRDYINSKIEKASTPEDRRRYEQQLADNRAQAEINRQSAFDKFDRIDKKYAKDPGIHRVVTERKAQNYKKAKRGMSGHTI